MGVGGEIHWSVSLAWAVLPSMFSVGVRGVNCRHQSGEIQPEGGKERRKRELTLISDVI